MSQENEDVRVAKLEENVESIQKTLHIFQQCLQNTHQLQQKILEQLNQNNA